MHCLASRPCARCARFALHGAHLDGEQERSSSRDWVPYAPRSPGSTPLVLHREVQTCSREPCERLGSQDLGWRPTSRPLGRLSRLG